MKSKILTTLVILALLGVIVWFDIQYMLELGKLIGGL